MSWGLTTVCQLCEKGLDGEGVRRKHAMRWSGERSNIKSPIVAHGMGRKSTNSWLKRATWSHSKNLMNLMLDLEQHGITWMNFRPWRPFHNETKDRGWCPASIVTSPLDSAFQLERQGGREKGCCIKACVVWPCVCLVLAFIEVFFMGQEKRKSKKLLSCQQRAIANKCYSRTAPWVCSALLQCRWSLAWRGPRPRPRPWPRSLPSSLPMTALPPPQRRLHHR